MLSKYSLLVNNNYIKYKIKLISLLWIIVSDIFCFFNQILRHKNMRLKTKYRTELQML